MSFRLAILLSLLLLLGCNTPTQMLVALPTMVPQPALPDTGRLFAVVPQLTRVGYEVDEAFLPGADSVLDGEQNEGVKTTVGTTSAISGQIALNFVGDGVELISAEFSADITTLKTNSGPRDASIRNSWLRANDYPRATFTATELIGLTTYAEETSLQFQLLGDLQIRGLRRAVTLDVTGTLVDDTLTASARLPLRMTDFGFNPPNIIDAVVVEDEFVLFVDLTAAAR